MSKSILITGASRGLGRSLAISYAKKDVCLFISGRNKDRLKEITTLCENKGAKVFYKNIDVTNYSEMKSWIEECWKIKPIDLVIANAGISAGTSGKDGETAEQARLICDVNIMGVINTVTTIIPMMEKQNSGQIAIVSSLAGMRGLPSSPAYSASKAAVCVYGDAIRGLLAHKNISVSVIIPGYIKTAMTDVNEFPMPFLITSEKAAKIIKSGLNKKKARIVFPWQFASLVRLLAILPVWLTDGIFSKLPGKPNFKKIEK